MLIICLSLIFLAFAISCPLTAVMRHAGHWLGQVDKPGHRKIHERPIPSTGGFALFWAISLPILAAVLAPHLLPDSSFPQAVQPNLQGLRQQTPLGLTLLLCLALLHVTGIVDDRKAMGPWSKLVVQLLVAAVPVLFFNVRLLEALDGAFSITVTILWIVAITNAFNFLDNMDGLSGGVAAICGALLLTAAVLSGQWFVGATLALLVGALAGFLVFNFPPASIFMGDCGSLLIGYLLALCSVKITYYDPQSAGIAGHWWAVGAPLIILAIPLYDLTSVTLLRLAQGKSPLVGDTQHFSHRLVRKGLSRRAAVGVIWACTFATGVSGILLPYLLAWQAMIVLAQTLAILLVLALLEYKVKSHHPL